MKTGDSFVYEIQLYTSSFMTSAVWLCYHLHFGQVCLIALYMFRKNLSPSNIFHVVQNNIFFVLGTGMRRERETDKESVFVYMHAPDMHLCSWWFWKVPQIVWFGQWRMETVPFVSGCVSFSTTFLPPYLLLMRSLVSDSELQQAFW